MTNVNTTVEVLTAVAGTGAGAVAHRFWQDLIEYLAGHRVRVEQVADEIVNRGIDVLAQVSTSPRDSSVQAPDPGESVKTASVPASGEEV